MSSKVICHIDLNAFFVRCEEIKNPKLINKPVAIGHEGRAGIVSTSSYIAREFGVKSGMPMYKAKQLCPNLIILPDDFRFYHKKSKEFINFVKKYTQLVEQASVDECFADFTSVVKGMKNPLSFFKNFQDQLYKETQLKCSIGVAPTRFLAKMGSDYKKPMGITVIRKRDARKILGPLPVGDFFGIGRKTAPRLNNIGINTIEDLASKIESNDEMTRNAMGKYQYSILGLLNGEGSDEIYTGPFDPKSIGTSTTLYKDTDDVEEVKNVLKNLCHEVSENLFRENKIGNTVQLVIKTPDFKSFNKSKKLNSPTSDPHIMYETAEKLFDNFFAGKMIRLIGVTMQNLISPQDIAVQMSFFDYEKHEEESATKLLINDFNRKLEKPLLMRASEAKKK